MVVVEVKWSKTLQNRQKELLLPLVPAKHKVICAVFWLRYVLGRRPRWKVGDLLFAWVKNGHLMPITYGFLSRMLKEWATKTGRQADEYTLHGLRHRGMNQALMVGICSEDLQLVGGLEVQHVHGIHRPGITVITLHLYLPFTLCAKTALERVL